MAEPVQPFSPEDMARRRKRNVVLALVLVGMMVLFFVSTLVRLGSSILERSL
jgi:hypothetical protein